ncbi:hypothetical protein DSO57_1035266 [Entomophthora muscae]|uniref:Uncharacterized protein n=1 Tax=Entomophthora muscae TaxID=34485 RepID=A0ACC2SNY1_9FUNG|nr:hypothetical protein DSO57_1035266 [Entomophthora muscae]
MAHQRQNQNMVNAVIHNILGKAQLGCVPRGVPQQAGSNSYFLAIRGLHRKLKPKVAGPRTSCIQTPYLTHLSVYFLSNRGYSCESKLASFWQGPVQVIQKTGPNSYTLKEPHSGQLITRVHTQYMCAALSDQE